MTQQFLGAKVSLTVRTADPAADGDGILLAQFASGIPGPSKRPKRFLIRVTLTGGTSTTLTLWTKDRSIATASGAWGRPVDPSGNLAQLASGAALPSAKTYWFIFEDVGCFEELVLRQQGDVGGTVTTVAEITGLYEFVGGV